MFSSFAVLALSVSSAYAHAFINSVEGANGVNGMGLGVTFNGEVARGGTGEQPFQLDTPVLKDTTTDPCGSTLLAGSINIEKSMAAVEKAMGGMPTIPDDGSLTMGVFQVNADGGGPFTAEINTDATGAKWTAIDVTSQPPGVNGVLHNGPANSSITVNVPKDTKCTGGSDGATCLIRLNNGGADTGSLANGAGPFGGCVAVSQGNNAVATGNNNNSNNGGNGNGRGGNGNGNGRGGNGNGRGGNRGGNNNASNNGFGFFGRLAARHGELQQLKQKRELLDRSILEARQKLTAQLIDELKTTTGTAIDIPIDRMAGFDDAAATGGNSTEAQSNDAPLTQQEAVDLKKAVQLAIEQALDLMASDEVDAGQFGQDSDITDKLNAQANADQAAGTTSINAGNAGVGFFQTDVVDQLLGGIKTASADLQATGTAAAAQSTITSNGNNGKGNNGGKNNGGNNSNNGGNNGGNNNGAQNNDNGGNGGFGGFGGFGNNNNANGGGRGGFGGNNSNNRRRMQQLKRRISQWIEDDA